MSRVSSLQLSYQSAPTKWLSLGILSLSATFFMLFSLNGHYDFSYQVINPRLWQYFLAVFSGGALGVAGLLLQKLTKNPLADISLLGIGSLNIIAISLFILFQFDGNKSSLPNLKLCLPIISLIASIIGTAIVYRLSAKRKSSQSLVISGISFQFFCEAISIAILQFSNKSDKNNSIQITSEISNYSYGKLPNLGVTTLFPQWRIATIFSFVMIAIVSGIVWLYRRELELLEIGDDYATSQGVNVTRLKKLLFGLISVLAGLESALVGTISLLGIIAPHLARFIFGNKASSNVIASFICGALLVVIATFISINLDQNIPIGILSTAIITPIFLFLVVKHSR